MKHVYVVQRLREDPEGYSDVKFIGVYSSQAKAEKTASEFKVLPGFSDYADGFHVGRYEINADHWVEGFVDLAKKTASICFQKNYDTKTPKTKER
ncbi:MAG: hypothetical protein HZA50_13200 [Planctomycetes bacterium]|nr:hypothetical protein [Planctomycetota bacterium]